MKVMYVFLLLVLGLTAVSAFAQTRTVTNFDLEKYRERRVQAEKDLNENYEKLGFASPEERQRRLEAWKKESQALSDQWARERIEQENANALAAQAAAEPRYSQPAQIIYPSYDNGIIYGYGNGFRNRSRFRTGPVLQQPQGYFAGGAFWPSPSTARLPLFVPPRPPRPRH